MNPFFRAANGAAWLAGSMYLYVSVSVYVCIRMKAINKHICLPICIYLDQGR